MHPKWEKNTYHRSSTDAPEKMFEPDEMIKIVSGCEGKHLKGSGKINMYKPGKWEKLHHQGEEEVIGKTQVVHIVANICVEQQLCHISSHYVTVFVEQCNVGWWYLLQATDRCTLILPLGENGKRSRKSRKTGQTRLGVEKTGKLAGFSKRSMRQEFNLYLMGAGRSEWADGGGQDYNTPPPTSNLYRSLNDRSWKSIFSLVSR